MGANSLPVQMTKNAARRDKFQAIDRELRELAWRDRRGEHSFNMQPRKVEDKELSSRLFGPKFKTWQMDPTVWRDRGERILEMLRDEDPRTTRSIEQIAVLFGIRVSQVKAINQTFQVRRETETTHNPANALL